MGTWNTKINGNDTFNDVYQNFFDLYNQGQDTIEITKQIRDEFSDMFEDHDDKNNSLFGLALAQWETKTLSSPPSLQRDSVQFESSVFLP